MHKIDFENHYIAPATLERMWKRAEAAEKIPPYIEKDKGVLAQSSNMIVPNFSNALAIINNIEHTISQMDKLGIDKMIISGLGLIEQLPVEESIIAAKENNDFAGEMCKKYPGKVYGSALLPVKDVDAACAELERCVKEYGFVSWTTFSNLGDGYIDEEKYKPIFAKAAELGVHVYLHPAPPLPDPRVDDYGIAITGAAYGYTIDTMHTLFRLVLGGVFDENPDLKVVVGHLGEALPFLLDRIENRMEVMGCQWSSPLWKCKQPFGYYFKNQRIFVGTSGNMCVDSFNLTRKVVGIDNMVIATDYPFESVEEMNEYLRKLRLTEEERERLFYKNAEEYLGIKM